MKGAKFESVIDAGEEDRKKAESSTKVFVGLKAICFALCCVEAFAGTVAC